MKQSIRMKVKLLFLLTVICNLQAVFGQAPQKMNYQAVVRNANNDLVSNTIIGMKISILKTTATGTAVYEETQNPTTNNNGLAVIEIGNGTVVSGSFPNIDWANDLYFVKTETDPFGGTNYIISGTSQLTSVPYALSSADNKWAANANGINNISGNVGIGTSLPSSDAYGHGGTNKVLEINNSNNSENAQSQLVFSSNSFFNSTSLGGINWVKPSFSGDKRITYIGTESVYDAFNYGGQLNFWTNYNGTLYKRAHIKNNGTFRIEGYTTSTNLPALSLGGFGEVDVDAPGVIGGRFKINDAGNIGIGTNAPTTKLDVAGKTRTSSFQVTDNASAGKILTSDATGNATWQTPASGTNFWTASGGNISSNSGINVGIGTTTPNAPLGFPPTLGKKITLYPGQTGDVGFGVAGNRLQLYTDNPDADVAIGYDAAGVFNEKLAVKANGAIAVNSNMGTVGQVLTSAGPDGQVVWSKPLNVNAASWSLNSNTSIINSTTEQSVSFKSITIPAGQNAIILVSAKIQLIPGGCSGLGCLPRAEVSFYRGSFLIESTIINLDNFNGTQEYVLSNFPLVAGPGTHNYSFSVRKVNTQTTDVTVNVRNNTAIVIPQ